MNKLLITLFSIIISFNSYGDAELDFSLDKFCNESPEVEIKNNLYYLLDKEKPYSGENICVYSSNGQKYNQGLIKNGLTEGIWSFWKKNGQLKYTQYYENGELLSNTKYNYNKNGDISNEFNYENNTLVDQTDYLYYAYIF